MSMPKVKLHVQPVPRTLMRVGVAGDFLKNLSLGTMTDESIRRVQQLVAEGLVKSLTVTGLDYQSIPRERYQLIIDPLNDDSLVMLDLEGGKSTIEAVDVGLAGAVAAAVGTLRRRNLRPDVTFQWSPSAMANPTRRQEAASRSGFVEAPNLEPVQSTTDPTPWETSPDTPSYPQQPPSSAPQGYEFRKYLEITPGKDRGLHFVAECLRRLR